MDTSRRYRGIGDGLAGSSSSRVSGRPRGLPQSFARYLQCHTNIADRGLIYRRTRFARREAIWSPYPRSPEALGWVVLWLFGWLGGRSPVGTCARCGSFGLRTGFGGGVRLLGLRCAGGGCVVVGVWVIITCAR